VLLPDVVVLFAAGRGEENELCIKRVYLYIYCYIVIACNFLKSVGIFSTTYVKIMFKKR
jgi:hypothetical protein